MRIKAPWGEMLDLAPNAPAIWQVLEKGVRWALGRHGAPPDPYSLDIAYRREPVRNGRRRDYYQPWWEVVAQRHGDCEDLSMFRAAYLRASGLDPSARVALIEWPSGGWHAVVARQGAPDPANEDYTVEDLSRMYGSGAHVYLGKDVGWDVPGWTIEDPSRRLGMRDTSRGRAYAPTVQALQREPANGASMRTGAGGDPYVPFEVAGGVPGPLLARELARIRAALL